MQILAAANMQSHRLLQQFQMIVMLLGRLKSLLLVEIIHLLLLLTVELNISVHFVSVS